MSDNFENIELDEINDSGYIFSRKKIDEIPFSSHDYKQVNLPPLVDLRQYMTKIESQGQVGSCTANAVAGAFEYLVKRYKGESYDVSRLFIYYNGREISGKEIKDDGLAIRNAIESLKRFCACSENTYPYIPELVNEKPPQQAYDEAASFLVESVEKIETNLSIWKGVLADGLPIIFALRLYDSFDKHSIKGLVQQPSENEKGRNGREKHALHAMLCVGYSDPDKVFIVRNSWGHNWGDRGYCYIPYDYLISDYFNLGDNWIIKRLDNFEDKKEDYWFYNENSIFQQSTNKTILDLFSVGNKMFWVFLLTIGFLFFSQFFYPIFDFADIKKKYVIRENKSEVEEIENKKNKKDDPNENKKNDSNDKKPLDDDRKFYNWKWTNQYNNKSEHLEFSIKDSDYLKSRKNRESIFFTLSAFQVYANLSDNDSEILENLILALKDNCKKQKLDYMGSLEYVISAIQTIPYTLVTFGEQQRCPCTLSFGSFVNDCSPRADRKGCCNDISPFGVFAPAEFAVQKTGDCDTRTLFAYTVLSALNYDVTILNSDAEGHSILGVQSPKPLGNGAYVLGKNLKKYYIWELTSFQYPGINFYKSNISTWYSIFK